MTAAEAAHKHAPDNGTWFMEQKRESFVAGRQARPVLTREQIIELRIYSIAGHSFDPMESKNLGYYRTEVTCECGTVLWWGDHDEDPHYAEVWLGHVADALLAQGDVPA